MGKTSAGLLPYRVRGDVVEVFVAHMGGPLWARKDAGAWTLVKGEFDPAREQPTEVARREFVEEVGAPAPGEPWLDLGEFRQRSGKVVTAFAVQAPDVVFVASNEFDLEWPRGSGRIQSFPEVDRALWLPVDEARTKLVSGQVPILDRLLAHLNPACG